MGGLPRSGNTLLSALLNQNPNVYVTTTSPLVEIMWRTYSMWSDVEYSADLSTTKMQSLKNSFLQEVQQSFHKKLTSREVIIDKRRQWQNVHNIEMYVNIYNKRPKILCPVRDVDEIMSSFDTVFKNNNIQFDYDKELSGNRFGGSYFPLKEALNSDYKDCFHLIEFNDLISNTAETLDKIYDFLELDKFNHDIDNIRALEEEGDHGLVGLHTLPNKILKNNPDKINKQNFKEYQDWVFWR